MKNHQAYKVKLSNHIRPHLKIYIFPQPFHPVGSHQAPHLQAFSHTKHSAHRNTTPAPSDLTGAGWLGLWYTPLQSVA